ncbi:MAG: WD40/YVTN/BNR-like repeat-containing protein, partial [bacterium]
MLVYVLYLLMHQSLSIRAIDIIDENKICFAANNGVFGYSDDAGKTWYLDTINIQNYTPQFRSIEVLNDSTILILSIDSPAYLLKTINKGRDWKIVYENHEKGVFFDAMKAKNGNEIWAIGDPVNNSPYLIYSNNAGDTWQKYDAKNLPSVEKNEAFFAASNSNLSYFNDEVYLVSGGSTSKLIQVNTKAKSYSI